MAGDDGRGPAGENPPAAERNRGPAPVPLWCTASHRLSPSSPLLPCLLLLGCHDAAGMGRATAPRPGGPGGVCGRFAPRGTSERSSDGNTGRGGLPDHAAASQGAPRPAHPRRRVAGGCRRSGGVVPAVAEGLSGLRRPADRGGCKGIPRPARRVGSGRRTRQAVSLPPRPRSICGAPDAPAIWSSCCYFPPCAWSPGMPRCTCGHRLRSGVCLPPQSGVRAFRFIGRCPGSQPCVSAGG